MSDRPSGGKPFWLLARLWNWAVRKRPARVFAWPFWLITPLLLLLSTALAELWIFQYPNLLSNETVRSFMRPTEAHFTALVAIDREEYPDFSLGRSPLTVKRLQDAVCSVLSHRPAVLVVDFDTSDSSYQKLEVPSGTAIVWARPIYRFRRETAVGDFVGHAGGAGMWGFSVGAEDPDGVVRRFPREIKVDGRWFPTLHWRAVQLASSGTEHRTVSSKPLEVTEVANDFEIPTYKLRELSGSSHGCRIPDAATPPDFSGKVVVLGGNYDFLDTHWTSAGEKWGSEMVASAIEAELSGEGVRHLGVWGEVALKGILAVLLALLYSRLFAVPATLVAVVLLVPAVVFGNVLAVWIWGFDGMVVPFVLGMMIELLATSVEKADEAQREEEGFGSHGD
jgi:hypothetical protein